MYITDIVNLVGLNGGGANAAPSATTVTILAAGTNVSGAILLCASFCLNSTVATAVNCAIKNSINTAYVLGGRIDAGAIICASFVLPKPVFFPAGQGIDFVNSVSPANVQFYFSLRLL